MNRCYVTSLCVALLVLVFAAAGAAWATTYPAYTCTELVGVPNGNTAAPAAQGQSLLSNGTVIGQSAYQFANPTTVPTYYLCSWNSAGTRTAIANVGPNLWNAFGDGSGQYAASLSVEFYVWNGSSLVPTGNSNLATGIDFNGIEPKWIVRGGPRGRQPSPGLGLRPQYQHLLFLRPERFDGHHCQFQRVRGRLQRRGRQRLRRLHLERS